MFQGNSKIFPLYIVITFSIVLVFINYAVFHFFAYDSSVQYSIENNNINDILLINLLSFILIPIYTSYLSTTYKNAHFPASFRQKSAAVGAKAVPEALNG